MRIKRIKKRRQSIIIPRKYFFQIASQKNLQIIVKLIGGLSKFVRYIIIIKKEKISFLFTGNSCKIYCLKRMLFSIAIKNKIDLETWKFLACRWSEDSFTKAGAVLVSHSLHSFLLCLILMQMAVNTLCPFSAFFVFLSFFTCVGLL